MRKAELKEAWLREQEIAHIHGWDFSHLQGRCEEEDLPWSYKAAVRSYLGPGKTVLDIDTGGGEFLLSLGHPGELLSATEAYPPNVELCKRVLPPLGVDFREADGNGPLPFPAESFDLVIDRHGDFNAAEIYRVLRPGGAFVTQQVGAENDRELTELLLGETPLPFPEQDLKTVVEKFRQAGFRILRAEEAFCPIRFLDVGALVWFARVIPWEFPDFSVEACLPRLYRAQELLEKNGAVEGTVHRFLLVAEK